MYLDILGASLFLDFSAHVLAEDDHVMKCNGKDFVLKLWSVENNSSSTEPPSKVLRVSKNTLQYVASRTLATC
jgi:hypothetical protein